MKNGKTPQGKHRYQCREQPCDARTFILDYAYPGQSKKVKEQIVDMALNGNAIPDTAEVLRGNNSSANTSIRVLDVSTSTLIT